MSPRPSWPSSFRPHAHTVPSFFATNDDVFRLRRKISSGWERYSLTVEPRSAYLLRGNARTHWEHSIPAVDSLRYSITFRSLRPRP